MAKKVKKTETVVVDVTPTVEVKTENRGRKVNPTSARQMRIAAQNAKKAAGIVVKRGRPKTEKPVVEDTAKAE